MPVSGVSAMKGCVAKWVALVLAQVVRLEQLVPAALAAEILRRVVVTAVIPGQELSQMVLGPAQAAQSVQLMAVAAAVAAAAVAAGVAAGVVAAGVAAGVAAAGVEILHQVVVTAVILGLELPQLVLGLAQAV